MISNLLDFYYDKVQVNRIVSSNINIAINSKMERKETDWRKHPLSQQDQSSVE